MKKHSPPMIGITADLADTKHGDAQAKQNSRLFSLRRYDRAIAAAGGMPVILPPTPSKSATRQMLLRLDGLLISGGNFDIHPKFYGEKPIGELGIVMPERTDFELDLAELALNRDMPMLGICGGAQVINVALGGSLYQDIAAQIPHAGNHQQGKKNRGHRIIIPIGSRLREIIMRPTLEVNTTHHQAVKRLGKGLRINANSADGLIEGIESPQHSFILGVQWHPEVLSPKSVYQRRIFASFIAICRSPFTAPIGHKN